VDDGERQRLTALYGTCEICGEPRQAIRRHLGDGSTMMLLVCLNGHESG